MTKTSCKFKKLPFFHTKKDAERFCIPGQGDNVRVWSLGAVLVPSAQIALGTIDYF